MVTKDIMVFPINEKENSVVLRTPILKISGLLTSEYIPEFDQININHQTMGTSPDD